MRGLREVIFALADAGVVIVTLEDGARYDSDALNRDMASLVVLVIKIQSATSIPSGSASGLAAWEATREAIRSGIAPRNHRSGSPGIQRQSNST